MNNLISRVEIILFNQEELNSAQNSELLVQLGKVDRNSNSFDQITERLVHKLENNLEEELVEQRKHKVEIESLEKDFLSRFSPVGKVHTETVAKKLETFFTNTEDIIEKEFFSISKQFLGQLTFLNVKEKKSDQGVFYLLPHNVFCWWCVLLSNETDFLEETIKDSITKILVDNRIQTLEQFSCVPSKVYYESNRQFSIKRLSSEKCNPEDLKIRDKVTDENIFSIATKVLRSTIMLPMFFMFIGGYMLRFSRSQQNIGQILTNSIANHPLVGWLLISILLLIASLKMRTEIQKVKKTKNEKIFSCWESLKAKILVKERQLLLDRIRQKIRTAQRTIIKEEEEWLQKTVQNHISPFLAKEKKQIIKKIETYQSVLTQINTNPKSKSKTDEKSTRTKYSGISQSLLEKYSHLGNVRKSNH